MSLDPSYLDYPRRARGMDHDFYGYSNIFERPPMIWPGGANVAVAIVVNLEWFPILPNDAPFRASGHMVTPYPDYRHYTAREYGSRVGFYRLLDAFKKVGARASVATNAAIAERYPQIITDILDGGHEIVAHSTDMNGTIASGLPEDAERALIAQTLDTLLSVAGLRPSGWMSIARSQSFHTPRLLVEAGFDYMCDWVNDDLPFRFRTPSGDLLNVPVNHELSDRHIITVQQNGVDAYVEQMQDAYRLFEREAARFGGRMLSLNVTPYVLGLPYRIDAFERLLAWIAEQPGSAFLTAGEIAATFKAGADGG
jgi:allantoinase